MMYVVQDTIVVHTADWTGNPNFDLQTPELEAQMLQLEAMVARQAQSGSTSTLAKKQRRTTLERLGTNLSKNLQALAANVGDPDLAGKVHWMPSDFLLASDELLVGIASQLEEIATDVIASPPPPGPLNPGYNISTDKVDKLTLARKAFIAYIKKPKSQISEHHSNTQALALKLTEIEAILKILDKGAGTIGETNASFERIWFNARALTDPGSVARALDVNVGTNDNLPISHARVIILRSDGPGSSGETHITGESGHVQWDRLPSGTYNLQVIKDGFRPHVETCYITVGDTTVINVTLISL